jgi:hypothetical protein
LPAAGRQQLSQLFPGTVDERPGRDLRHTKDLRDLLERQAFLVAQHDRDPMLIAQGVESPVDGAAKRFGLYGIGRSPRRRQMALDLGIRRRIVDGHERHARPAPGIDGGVMCDSEQPTRQSPRRVERRELEVGLDERLLSEILSRRTITLLPQNADDQADDGPLVTPDDLFECRLGTSQSFCDEPAFSDRLEIDRDGPRPLS